MRAFITGANSLVNAALLEKLLAMGYEVTAHYHSDNEMTAEIKQKYPDVKFIQADFADPDSFQNLLEQISGDKFDVLVNGAVYYAEAEDWQVQRNWHAWQKNFAVNTSSAGVLMAVADRLLNKGSVVVNISSTFGQKYLGEIQFTMYGASKAALDSLTVAYAKRWAPDVRVVGIGPGWVRSAWNEDMSEEEMADMLKGVVPAKLVEPAEIADLMELIIKNPSINATTIIIDGGLGAPII